MFISNNYRNLASLTARIDIFSSFEILVYNTKNAFCGPKLGKSKTKFILEKSCYILLGYLNRNNSEVISNDLTMTTGEDDFHLLTGINIGGKSTYLRQIEKM